MLGIREPEIYGKNSYQDLLNLLTQTASNLNIEIEHYQSNHEGCIVDKIQDAYNKFQGIIINPAAYTHTSIAILDALKSVGIPTVEVHLSDINTREEFRKFSYISLYAEKTICGKKFEGYKEAILYLKEKYSK
jgi:3-dehydroquinate dehydratase-2